MKLSWSKKMKEKQKEGPDEKQELAKQRETQSSGFKSPSPRPESAGKRLPVSLGWQ